MDEDCSPCDQSSREEPGGRQREGIGPPDHPNSSPLESRSNLPKDVTGDGSTLFEAAAALYLRVSTEDQDLAGQERDLRTFAAARRWTVAAVYSEKVSATGKVEREAYDRLLKDAARPDRGWDTILVWSLDRFTYGPSAQAWLTLHRSLPIHLSAPHSLIRALGAR
jgi:hypothetical protein